MTTTATDPTGSPDGPDSAVVSAEPVTGERPRATRRRLGLRWWREVVYVIGFYLLYSVIRNTFGSSGTGGEAVSNAFGHGVDVIDIEKSLHLWIEPGLQRWYLDLPSHGFIRVWNIYYGTAHFVVTIAAMVLLFRREPGRYAVWRNTLAIMTAAALIGFASFSLMPPRLLGDNGTRYGACYGHQPNCKGYDFVDTLDRYGGLWNFDSGPVAKISNQYAAMPSLHTGWSTWCAFVLFPMTRRRWLKVLIALYPVATIFGIMVTANHYWLDAVGGLVVFAIGYLPGAPLARFLDQSRARRVARRRPPTVLA